MKLEVVGNLGINRSADAEFDSQGHRKVCLGVFGCKSISNDTKTVLGDGVKIGGLSQLGHPREKLMRRSNEEAFLDFMTVSADQLIGRIENIESQTTDGLTRVTGRLVMHNKEMLPPLSDLVFGYQAITDIKRDESGEMVSTVREVISWNIISTDVDSYISSSPYPEKQ